MSASQLRAWLATRELSALADIFVAEDITLDLLPDLTDEDLRELGLSVGMRRRLRRALAETSGETASEAAAQPLELPQQGVPGAAERRHITVMFVDLVGSTAMSVAMDPEDLREPINTFHQRVSTVIARYEGFVARFMGDGLLAYFGFPVAHEDDAERAVRAAQDIVDAAAGLAGGVRVGIASGLVVVGDVLAAGETRERSVVGETPNLAARLQAIARPGQIVVSAATRRLVGDVFAFASLGAHELKGFADPVTVFAVGARSGIRTRFAARSSGAHTPLLGRDVELSLLCERWELARAGEGQVMLLLGEAGIGKSRIVHALLEYLSVRGSLVFQCSPLYPDSPLWPVLDALRRTARIDAAPSAASCHARLARVLRRAAVAPEVVPLAAEALGLGALPDHPYPQQAPQKKRQQLLHGLLEGLLAQARRQPVLLIIEDVHWIDPSTLELIGAGLGAIREVPVMVLLTSRPDRAPDLAAHPHVTRLTLNRLSRQAVQGLVRHMAGSHALTEDLLGGIVSRSDGVPLFVEELTKAVLESTAPGASGAVRERAGVHIPQTLHESLMARLDRAPALKGVAQTAACIGREFEFRLLERVAELPRAALAQALDGLVAAGLVFRHGTPPEVRYAFKHALVRDAAYESLLNAHRRARHAAIADALEAGAASAPPELVALHAALAGDAERAIACYLAAGRAAALAYANAEAVRHYEQALSLLATQPPGALRDERELALLKALGVPLIAVRGYASPEVEQVFRRALALCELLGLKDERRFAVLRGLWNCLYDRSELDQAQDLAHALVDLAERHADPGERALAYRALGSTLYVRGELASGRQALERVLAAREGWSTPETRAVHGEAPELIARKYAGWVATMQGRVDTGLALVEDGLRRARTLEFPIAIAFSLSILEIVLWLRRDAVGCQRVAAENLALCDQHGFVFWRAHSDVFAGWAEAQHAPSAHALAQTRGGLDAWMRTGAVLHVPTWSCVLAEVALARVVEGDDCADTIEARALRERLGSR